MKPPPPTPPTQLLLTGNPAGAEEPGPGQGSRYSLAGGSDPHGGVRIQETAWGGGVSEQKHGDSVLPCLTWEGSDLP